MKKGILFLVLVLWGLLCANSVIANELTDDYFDIANNYYCSNNYAKALEYLDLILAIDSSDTRAKALRDKISPPPVDETKIAAATAQVLTTTQAPEATTIIEVPKADTETIAFDTNYYNSKGKEFYQKKEYYTAIDYFCKAVELNKRNVVAYNNMAMSYWILTDTNLAVKYFKKANSINPKYTQPLVNLALLYKGLGDEKKELYYLKKAVLYNCNDYLAYYWLGDYYRNCGNYQKAIENFKEVIKINPKFSQAYLNLAMSFFEIEEFDYTIMSLSQYQEFYPDSDYAYFLTAKAYLAMGKYNEAKDYILKAININDTCEYDYELAKVYYFQEDYASALDIFQHLLQAGDSAETFNYVGLCNYKLKNTEVAIINFNKAIELDGLRPIYYYNLAQCYKSLGDKKNYAKYVNTATKINPINYQDFIDLSYIYVDNGNTNYAVNALNNAISKYPNVKSLYIAKLRIFEAAGDDLNYNETKNTINMRFNQK